MLNEFLFVNLSTIPMTLPMHSRRKSFKASTKPNLIQSQYLIFWIDQLIYFSRAVVKQNYTKWLYWVVDFTKKNIPRWVWTPIVNYYIFLKRKPCKSDSIVEIMQEFYELWNKKNRWMCHFFFFFFFGTTGWRCGHGQCACNRRNGCIRLPFGIQ